MYAKEYAKRGIRNSELGATILAASRTSALIPWNTCGIYCMTVLGVSPVRYAPFAFFCLLTPLLTILFSLLRRENLPAKEKNPKEVRNGMLAEVKNIQQILYAFCTLDQKTRDDILSSRV